MSDEPPPVPLADAPAAPGEVAALGTAGAVASSAPGSVGEVLGVALRLGLTSFGGPIAHLGYFHEAYVVRRRWLDEQTFADLVALCQFLPGPASSELGIAIGTLRAGPLGGLAAWLGFTLPSAVAMTAFAYLVDQFNVADAAWLHGLKVVAVAVVAQAVWTMARQFCTDRARATIALLATLVVLAAPSAIGQIGVIAGAGLLGWRLFPSPTAVPAPAIRVPLSRRLGLAAWVLFFALLLGLPLLRVLAPDGGLALFDSFYRVGALVFGGGHVVLPLLQAEVVPPEWVTNTQFIAGYGAAQAVPGPLFTFAAYLGAVRGPVPHGMAGAVIGLVAIFLPAFLLIGGALPFWDALRRHPAFQSAIRGINAAVVGILLAALYTPVWTSAVRGPADFGLATAAVGLLMIGKLPPWSVVLFTTVGGAVLAFLR
jgi:chromate transporter